jgi:hydroxymethylpyrimidine/phosphomethylpyrimidine kinase
VPKQKRIPVALTIAGSDSGGGAGIQADLKTFASLGVHGVSAITCVTAQNPKRVLGIESCKPEIVRRQLQAVFTELPPVAAKTGMLFSAAIVRAVADFFETNRRIPLVVDPVMVSTSRTPLLQASAIRLLQSCLLPLATLVTPNLSEAAILTGRTLKDIEDMRHAAREIRERFGCAALVKGGHLQNSREAVDIFFDGKNELLLQAPFVKGARTHGTGCTYSAAITAYLSHGDSLGAAVTRAKEYISQAIAGSLQVGRHSVLEHGVGERRTSNIER